MNATTTRNLIDSETGTDLGPATDEQIYASDRESEGGGTGAIEIFVSDDCADGRVVDPRDYLPAGTVTRRVWVEEA